MPASSLRKTPVSWKGRSMSNLSDSDLRDLIIRAHGMATGRYVQSDTVMRQRIGDMLETAISSDDTMRGFLGRGGPEAWRDPLAPADAGQKPKCDGNHDEGLEFCFARVSDLKRCMREKDHGGRCSPDPDAERRCPDCKKLIEPGGDDAGVCIECGGRNLRVVERDGT